MADETLQPTHEFDYPAPKSGPSMDDALVTQAIKAYRDQAEQAKVNRDILNKRNYDANLSRQDWSHKQAGQSTEFIPKVPMALEQVAAFVERGLLAYGNYFDVDLSPDPAVKQGPLTDSAIVKLLRARLEAPHEAIPGQQDFPATLADAIKVGGLGALVILKVHGRYVPERRPTVDLEPIKEMVNHPLTGEPTEVMTGVEERLAMVETKAWHLCVDLVRPEDFYPDPTGRGLFEIQRSFRDLHEIIADSEGPEPLYDPEAVDQLTASYKGPDDEYALARQTDQTPSTPPSFRVQVELLEFWGTILGPDGHVIHRNVVATIANDRFLLRKPEPNPFWHQQSPFVVAPLVRVPFSVWHKALFDNATSLNLAMNELINLIIDGGIGSVWGVRAVKAGYVENWHQFVDGIPQGATLLLKDEVPDGVPPLTQVASGMVPPEALAVYNLLDREFQAASMVTDAKLGLLSPKQVKATEVVEANQSSSIFFEGVIFDLESRVIRPALYKAWLTMLQHADDWDAEGVVGIIGPVAARALAMMSPARRYATYAQGCRFKVHGLSSITARAKEFQKLMAFLQAIAQNPILMQAFVNESSPVKLLHHIYKVLTLDPDSLKLSEEERATLQQRMQQLPYFQGLAQGAQGSQPSELPPQGGMPGMMEQIARMNNPVVGM